MALKTRTGKEKGQAEAERRIEVAKETKATEFDLSNLQLTTLPESLWHLSQLQSLEVRGNQLTSLPEALGKLFKLQLLDVSHNQLTSLPEALGQLSQLQLLDVSHNRLTSLPKALGKLSQLQELFASNNKLTDLPEGLEMLTWMRGLYVSENKLTSLPGALGQLTQLRVLDVSYNRITSLPEVLGKLCLLQEMDLRGNQLTSLPEVLGKLTELLHLDVRYNELTNLPKSLSQLTDLKELFLHGNQGLEIPLEVLGATRFDVEVTPAPPHQILSYYFRTREGRRPLNEAKLILVGFGEVGKTCLVKRLVHDTFDPQEKETKGIEITQWPLALKEDEEGRLNIWDFGGQEIMHATHQFFLSQRSLYLLVLNGRQGREDADAEYWLNLIESFGGDSPVLVVLNKISASPFDVNRRELLSKFPTLIKGFISTDCEDRTGIDKLKEAIRRETDGLPHLRDAFPASWFAIKNRLAGMAEDYLTFDEYRKVCADLGAKDPQDQDSLAFSLHHLGIALNYRDDPRLRDMHVLNPHWVTNGIYAIITDNRIKEQKGKLLLSDIAGILDPEKYPPVRHSFLLELMRKFELAFRFPEEESRYLIPDLLDKQEPEAAAEFRPEACLNFKYYYPVIPEGLLPRFIVRSHVHSTGRPRWRTGVILEFDGNTALVKADLQGKKVLVSVAGPADTRQRLLAVIRADFEHLHRSYTFKPQEMVPLPDFPEVTVPYQKLRALEEGGITTFPEVVTGQVVQLNVTDLLNGVDLEGRPRAAEARETAPPGLRIFYSYSHKDENLRDEMETHLKLLQREGKIETWHDRRITAGEEWSGQIDDNLERADIVLLLVSSDFLASDYCYEKEMTRALERHRAGARVIPVIIRDCRWHKAPFGKLQALPKDGKAVATWGPTKHHRDSAWSNVAEGIEKVIAELEKEAKK